MILRMMRILDVLYNGCAITTIQHPGSFGALTATKKLTTVQRPYPVLGVAADLEQPYGGTNS